MNSGANTDRDSYAESISGSYLARMINGVGLEKSFRMFQSSLLAMACLVGPQFSACAEPSLPGNVDSGENYYPKHEAWGALNSGSENISLFVYRDMNRNGLYDSQDRAMANIAVKLHRPDGSHVVRRSNQYGFVNFVNSLGIPGVDIDEVGKYYFEVMVPSGWHVSSDNAMQVVYFKARPETRPGVVADNIPHPVGLATELMISGRIVLSEHYNESLKIHDVAIKATPPSGQTHEVQLDADGGFSIEAKSGEWELYVTAPGSSREIIRVVNVRQVSVNLSTILLGGEAISRKSSRHIIDFDRITESQISKMPRGPEGLDWTNLIVANKYAYLGAGYVNNAMSGVFVGYNSSGYPVSLQGKEFDFLGAYFGVAWPQAEGETLHIRAWRGDTLIGEDQIRLSALGPIWFDANYTGITRLELETRHYWQFVMDSPEVGLPCNSTCIE